MKKKGEYAKNGQVVYFSHGGGPLPILGDEGHRAMVSFMEQLPLRLAKPDAVLVVSAHWEEDVPTLLSAQHPPMFYDYYGFQEEAYSITYPAPGSPELAERIAGILGKHDMEARLDPDRGFDHGLFIPLKLMYPNADIPSLQLSLVQGLDPSTHIAMGHALGELMQENILVVGSGFSFHNLRVFFMKGNSLPDSVDPANDSFQDWLVHVCTGQMPEADREQRLIDWETAPSARYCHPREEHLMPLLVCAGIAGGSAQKIFDDYILGKRAVAFQW